MPESSDDFIRRMREQMDGPPAEANPKPTPPIAPQPPPVEAEPVRSSSVEPTSEPIPGDIEPPSPVALVSAPMPAVELSDRQRSDILQTNIGQYTVQGWRVSSQTPFTAQLTKSKTFSFLAAILWFLFFGIGILYYLFYYAAKRDDQLYMVVNSHGQVEKTQTGTAESVYVMAGVGGSIIVLPVVACFLIICAVPTFIALITASGIAAAGGTSAASNATPLTFENQSCTEDRGGTYHLTGRVRNTSRDRYGQIQLQGTVYAGGIHNDSNFAVHDYPLEPGASSTYEILVKAPTTSSSGAECSVVIAEAPKIN